MVPHRGTNWAALWLTLQIGRDAVLSESYGRGCHLTHVTGYNPQFLVDICHSNARPSLTLIQQNLSNSIYLYMKAEYM